MRHLLRIAGICLALGTLAAGTAIAEDNPVGARIKKDAKTFGTGMKKAATDVGKQIGTGTKRTVKSAGNKISKDVKSARRHMARNTKASAGRD